MNFLAAILLFFLDEEICFWMICTVVEDLLPHGFFASDLLGLRIDVEVFKVLFAQRLPKLAKHFEYLRVDAHSFIYQWFLSLYITVLSAEMAMRFLDCLFYDGSKIIFRLVLALFTFNQKSLLNTEDTLQLSCLCKELPHTITDMDELLMIAYSIPVSNKKLNEMRKQGLLTLKLKNKC